MAAQTKKFNARTATKVEFDRELKRIASAKCIAGQKLKQCAASHGVPVHTAVATYEDAAALQAKYDNAAAAYKKVATQKAKRFPGRKTYMDMTDKEIAELDLKTTVAGIASLACKRSRYPHLAEDVKRQEAKFQAHKAELTERAEFERLAKKYAAQ